MKTTRVDDEGFFIEDVITSSDSLNIITTPCPDGFFLPRWTGTEWIEGDDNAAVKRAALDKEHIRLELKRALQDSLNALTHTFEDGTTVQVRERDLTNFQLAIARGKDLDWILLDNTTRWTTVLELQEALASGIEQSEALWDTYINELKYWMH